MRKNVPGSAGNLGGATMNSSRAGAPSGSSGGTRATGRPAPVKKATAKKTTAAPAAPAAPAGRGAGPKTAAQKTAAPAKKTTAKKTTAAPATAPVKKTTAKKTTKKTTPPAPAPTPPASPQGRMARADAAMQARASAIAGRASSTFKRVPGSSQAAGMARKTGTTSVKAYNKLPGGKKTKMATAVGIGGGAAAVGAGMYADRNKGKPGSGKPKNGDTKTLGGRKATYRNGSWYAS